MAINNYIYFHFTRDKDEERFAFEAPKRANQNQLVQTAGPRANWARR